MPELCQPPDPSPRKPRLICPPGATDCHFHFYGPYDRYPASATGSFSVPEAPPAMCMHLHDVLGIDRVVVVQPSTYGFDNRRQLDAIPEMGRPGRAVVAVADDVTVEELKRLHGLGARGMRVSVGREDDPSASDMTRLAKRIADLGWHFQLHILRSKNTEFLSELEPTLRDLPVDVIIDHLATIPARAGVDHPEFQAMLRLLSSGKCWLKLSCGYRLSDEPPPYRDMAPQVQALLDVRPDRLVWGSDWPHVNFKGQMPNTTTQLDYLLDWVPKEEDRHNVLVKNPEVLYGFE